MTSKGFAEHFANNTSIPGPLTTLPCKEYSQAKNTLAPQFLANSSLRYAHPDFSHMAGAAILRDPNIVKWNVSSLQKEKCSCSKPKK